MGMDEHSSSSSGYISCQGDEERKLSYLFDHLPVNLSSYASTCAVGFLSSEPEQMPSSSFPNSSSCVDGGSKSLEQDFDSVDWESEEGLEVLEEPVKLVPLRSSGSKRSRAAEVHNMSEKRRRSRINEKMRALQNLIPNSNKTDKASMLDEAIEYLKQLQLQVQILSMRNGLNFHSMYMSGALQSLQASQMSIGFSSDHDPATKVDSTMIPLNQDSAAAQTSFGVPGQHGCSQPLPVMPGLINVTNPRMNSSQSQHGSFQVPPSCEAMFTGDLSTHMNLVSVHYAHNLSETERSSSAMNPEQVTGQTTPGICINHHLEELSNDDSFIHHLQGLGTGGAFPSADANAKEEHQSY
ncbi:transcription factor PHYTOCHROME INTERACTING FACTOR-LIKE 15-like [Zingiber officinale]|uniref:BHLH domain-containing protein n=1 Tax=Zingiber officinale TaxID=94328 RepID=A0A8J5LLV5_ZINOF|nr:transcription factor PHYTOCHROME INTERACTING FACTOR-LIKE 15-like [Zingiber officinale]KAG6530641.1 hypothetical protein ZIOFF_012884 [Zingiber officinale]